MCRAVRCQQCGKTTWAGCGAHVQQVMAGVPEGERCQCDKRKAEKPSGDKQAGSLAALLGFK